MKKQRWTTGKKTVDFKESSYETSMFLTQNWWKAIANNPIGHSEARDCDKQSEIVDLQLTNQIPDLLYPTIPYNTIQYL